MPRLSSPLAPWRSLVQHREVVLQLVLRDVRQRYRGALLGLFWIVLQPLVYLGTFALFFAAIQPGRARIWAAEFGDGLGFTLAIFIGLIVFWLVSECLNRSPGLIRSEVGLVKDVVFPLEVLPWVTLGQALFNAAARLSIWAIAYVAILGAFPWTVAWLPVVIAPVILMTLGLSWFLAASGVFVRDLTEVVPPLTVAILFLSAVFFPLSIVPEPYRGYLLLNPVAFVIDQARQVALRGDPPDGLALGLHTLAGGLLFWAGFAWFRRLRRRFASAL